MIWWWLIWWVLRPVLFRHGTRRRRDLDGVVGARVPKDIFFFFFFFYYFYNSSVVRRRSRATRKRVIRLRRRLRRRLRLRVRVRGMRILLPSSRLGQLLHVYPFSSSSRVGLPTPNTPNTTTTSTRPERRDRYAPGLATPRPARQPRSHTTTTPSLYRTATGTGSSTSLTPKVDDACCGWACWGRHPALLLVLIYTTTTTTTIRTSTIVAVQIGARVLLHVTVGVGGGDDAGHRQRAGFIPRPPLTSF